MKITRLMFLVLSITILGTTTYTATEGVASPVSQGPENNGEHGPRRDPPTPTPTPTPTPSSCRPVNCKGTMVRSSYDVNDDCKVDGADSGAIVTYLNSGGRRVVNPTNQQYDVNRSSRIDYEDVRAINALLRNAGCDDRPSTCRTYALNISEPCEQWDINGNCIDYRMSGSGGGAGHVSPYIDITTSGAANQLSCLLTNLQSAFSGAGVPRREAPTAADLVDNRYRWSTGYNDFSKKVPQAVTYLLWQQLLIGSGLIGPPPTDPTELANYIAEQGRLYRNIRQNYVNCKDWANERIFNGWRDRKHQGEYGGFAGGGYVWDHQYTCHDGYAIFDSSCKLLSKQEVIRMCGELILSGGVDYEWIRHTPVSLIFDQTQNPMRDFTLVNFAFDPGKPAQTWEWRGSAAAPLLVYDPEKKRNVTSVQQLFGDWTFGGKRVASLTQSTADRWRDGFEALEQLDANGDGRISGSELDDIALWFDNNRDAISQPGEIKPIAEAGIQALFFDADKRDPETGDVTTTVGFQRLVDGKLVEGPAVDWVARGGRTAAETTLNRILGDANSNSVEATLKVVEAPKPQLETVTTSSDLKKLRESLMGIWMVRVDVKNTPESKDSRAIGFLAFENGEDSILEGSSILELAFATPGTEDLRLLKFTRFTGEATATGEKMGSISFASSSNGTTLTNRATVDIATWTLTGTTTAKTDKETFTYQWIAKKIPIQKSE